MEDAGAETAGDVAEADVAEDSVAEESVGVSVGVVVGLGVAEAIAEAGIAADVEEASITMNVLTNGAHEGTSVVVAEDVVERGVVEEGVVVVGEQIVGGQIVGEQIIGEEIKNRVHKLSPGSLGVTHGPRDICQCDNPLFVAWEPHTHKNCFQSDQTRLGEPREVLFVIPSVKNPGR